MLSGELLTLTILTGAAAAVGLILVLVAYLVQVGGRRAALAPAAASVALVAPVCGMGSAAKHLAQTFSDLAEFGSGSAGAIIAGCARARLLMHIGDGAAIATLVLAAGLGWVGAATVPSSRSTPASKPRLFALLFLFVLPVAVVAGLHEYARATNRIAVAVMEAPTAKPGEPGEGMGAVEVVSTRMARGVFVGILGAPVLLVALTGLAVASAWTGWRVEPPGWFRTTVTLLLLGTAALFAVGIAFFEWPVAIPR